MYCSGAACWNGGNSRVHRRRKKRMRKILDFMLFYLTVMAIAGVTWLIAYGIAILICGG